MQATPSEPTNSAPPASGSTEKYVDIVCEGGGVRGIALAGAIAELDAQGYLVQNMAGTSAGAVVAVLRAAGYQGDELRRIVANQNFKRLMDTTWLNHVPLLGVPLSVLARLGIYRGNVFYQQMRDLLAAKGVRTFKDLVHPAYADDPRYRYKVQIIASDVTEQRLLVLPRDAHLLGIEPDTLEVAWTVRMSMSIPLFFVPVLHRNPRTKQLHIIVDGGLLSGFPVWLFDSDGPPAWPTFGLRLVDGNPKSPLASAAPPQEAPSGRIGRLVHFGTSLIETMQNAHDRLYLERDVFARTIAIPTLDVDPHNFALSATEIAGLYESGRAATREFLQTWNFHAYVAAFRTGKPVSRRQDITEDMQRVTDFVQAAAPAVVPAVAPEHPHQ